MSNRPHDSVGFISWQDALAVWEQVERETNTVVELHVRVANVAGKARVISGNLTAYARAEDGHGEEISFVGFTFPHRDSATVTGALVARLYALHHYVERATAAKIEAQTELPF